MTEQQLLSNWRGNHEGLPCFYGQAEEVPAMFSGDRSQDAVCLQVTRARKGHSRKVNR